MTREEILNLLAKLLVNEIKISEFGIGKIADVIQGEEHKRILVNFPNYEEASDAYFVLPSCIQEGDLDIELRSATGERKVTILSLENTVQIAFYKKQQFQSSTGGITIRGNISGANINIGGVQSFNGDVVINGSKPYTTVQPEEAWVYDRSLRYTVE